MESEAEMKHIKKLHERLEENGDRYRIARGM